MRNLIIFAGIAALCVGVPARSAGKDCADFQGCLRAGQDESDQNKQIEYFSRAIDLWQESDGKIYLALAYTNRGVSYFGLKRENKAFKDFNKAIKVDDGYIYSYFYRGIMYSLRRQYVKAIADYDRVANCCQSDEQRSEFREVYPRRGEANLYLGRYPNAFSDLNTAIELGALPGYSYLYRGGIYARWKQYDEAIKDINKCIELGPEWPYPYSARGVIYSVLGEKQKAEEDFRKAGSLYPLQLSSSTEMSAIYVGMGWIGMWSGDCGVAKDNFEIALRHDRSDPYLYSALGTYWWHCRHDKNKAIKGFKTSFEKGFKLWDSLSSKVDYGFFIEDLNKDPEFVAMVAEYQKADDTLEFRKADDLSPNRISKVLSSLAKISELMKDPRVDGDIASYVEEKRKKIEQDPKNVNDLIEWFGGMGSFADNVYFNIFNLRPKSTDPAERAKEWEAAWRIGHEWSSRLLKEEVVIMTELKKMGARSPGLDKHLGYMLSAHDASYTSLDENSIKALEGNLKYEVEEENNAGSVMPHKAPVFEDGR